MFQPFVMVTRLTFLLSYPFMHRVLKSPWATIRTRGDRYVAEGGYGGKDSTNGQCTRVPTAGPCYGSDTGSRISPASMPGVIVPTWLTTFPRVRQTQLREILSAVSRTSISQATTFRGYLPDQDAPTAFPEFPQQ